MNAQWRLFLAALQWVTQRIPSLENGTLPHHAGRFVPLAGSCIGLIAATAYWASAQVWPTSIAVVVSLLAATLMTVNRDPPRPGPGVLYWVFVLFIKYNALMALSAANVPFPLPDYFALGLIMIAAHAASRGLVVSVMATDPPEPRAAHAASADTSVSSVSNAVIIARTPPVTTGDLVIALASGLTPAVLLGIPGLIGLVAAIVMRLGSAPALRKLRFTSLERLEVVQQLTEASFYLGALASWKYV